MGEPLTIEKFNDVLKLDDTPVIVSEASKLVNDLEEKLLIADQVQVVKMASSQSSPSGIVDVGHSSAVFAPSAVPPEGESDNERPELHESLEPDCVRFTQKVTRSK